MSSEHRIFGLHAVEAALKTGRVRELWLQAGRADVRLQRLKRRATGRGVVVHVIPRRELDEMAAGGRHQGAVAAVEEAKSLGEGHLLDLLQATREPPLLLVLDGVTDPHNLGACLRSADAAGVTAVIAPRDRAAGLTATARKVASGAAETVPFIQVTNLARTLREIQEFGVWVVGLAGEGEFSLYDQRLDGPLAIVMGAEGKGLRRLTRETCDALLRIPMVGTVGSLNVSVAAGVALFEALRQRAIEAGG